MSWENTPAGTRFVQQDYMQILPREPLLFTRKAIFKYSSRSSFAPQGLVQISSVSALYFPKDNVLILLRELFFLARPRANTLAGALSAHKAICKYSPTAIFSCKAMCTGLSTPSVVNAFNSHDPLFIDI